MINIEKNKSLKGYNTFGFNQRAEYYAEVSTDDQLSEIVAYAKAKSWPVFILGGGSNIVLTQDIAGLVIRMVGTQVNRAPNTGEAGELITVAAGKNWHELVLETLQMSLPGLENLSLIPGTVGAAPVQNIGAYGVEIKDRVTRVHALHIPSGEWLDFSREDCAFAYRHSFFKDKPNQYAITEVEFNLGTQCATNPSYTSLAEHLSTRGLSNPTAVEISQSVIAIRESRLPDPNVLGNAGSFFHNPVVPADLAQSLKLRYPGLVTFDAGPERVKLSAAWMIDQLGYKGLSRGGVGVYHQQALVLTHNGGGNGCALLALAEEIMAEVAATFGVQLSIEPKIV